MDEPIRILIVEDVSADAELARREIDKELKSCEYRVVETREEFLDALETFRPDLIISDYSLPAFDGMTALSLTREISPATPLIILTGSQNEDVAVRCIQEGAVDYVLKDSIRRLGSAAVGALEVKQVRIEKELAERAIRESEQRYRELVENIGDIIYVTDEQGRFTFLNSAAEQFIGYSRDEVLGRSFADFLTPESLEAAVRVFRRQRAGEDVGVFELDFYDRDGVIKTVETREKLVWKGKRIVQFQGIGRDITRRKRADDALRALSIRHMAILGAVTDIIMEVDTHKVYTWANQAGFDFFGDDVIGKEASFYFEGDQETYHTVQPLFDGTRDSVYVESLQRRRDGRLRLLAWWSRSLKDENGRVSGALSSARDITEQKAAEQALRESQERYRDLLELAPVGIAVQSEGKIVFTNPEGARIIGAKSPEEVIGRDISSIIHPDSLEGARDRIRRMMSGEQGVYPAENTYVRLDGSSVPVDVIAASVTYEGNPAVQVIVTDISSRKEAERAIRDSEQRYRELVESIDDILYVTDGTGKITYLNKALERISGYTRDELLQKNYMELLTPESLRKVTELFKTQRKGSDVGLFEISIVDKDGKVRIIEAREQMVWEGNRIVQMRGLGRDITARKRAEERIYHLSRVLESIRNIDQLIVRVENRDTLLTGACEILCEVSGYYFVWIGLVSERDGRVVPAAHWGYEDGYLDGITVTWNETVTSRGPIGTAIRTRRPSVFNDIATNPDFAPWRDEAQKRGYRSCMAIPITIGRRVYGAFGVYSDHTDIFDDEEVTLLTEVAEDIAFALNAMEAEEERKRSVTALAESEQRYRSLIDNMTIGIYRNTPGKKGRFIFSNRALLTMLGVPSFEELAKLSPADFYQAASDRKAFSDNLLKTGSVSGVELRLKKLDGTSLWGSVTARVVRDEKGKPAYFDCTLEDITERKRAEEAIRESEEKFRDFFETSRDIVFITTSEGIILDINTAFEEILGYTRQETLSRNVVSFYKNPQDRNGFKKAIDERGFVRDFDVVLRHKNGTDADCVMTAAARKNENGNIIGYQGTIRDVTEKKRMERQLLQAEKLSSLGGILSGVAHELNNPLTSIVGISQLIMRKPVSDDMREKLETIHRESLRTSKIIQGLLTFAREHKPERIMISVNQILQESYRLREYEFKVDNIGIQLDLSEDVPLTAADPYQLQQVFINLINNSHDALVTGGGKALVIRSLYRDDSIVIEFEDDGPGISPETIGFIFDPFFTTKEVGKGTGLGLSVAYGIIKEHGGKIDVESEPGKGTKFTVHLPRTAEIGEREAPQETRFSKSHDEKKVLVVEDEESLRDVIIEVLDQDGYSVEGCGDGDRAISMLKLKRYDAVITDLKMPGLGGKDLYTFIQKHYPKLAPRVLFITGDVLNKDTQRFLKITGNTYIEKPFEIEVLLGRLEEILQR
jgi:PAS domain S-box-containing protein